MGTRSVSRNSPSSEAQCRSIHTWTGRDSKGKNAKVEDKAAKAAADKGELAQRSDFVHSTRESPR